MISIYVFGNMGVGEIYLNEGKLLLGISFGILSTLYIGINYGDPVNEGEVSFRQRGTTMSWLKSIPFSASC